MLRLSMCPWAPGQPDAAAGNHVLAEFSIGVIRERRMVAFGAQFKVSAISAVVLTRGHDLQGPAAGALQELVAPERLSQSAAE